MNYADPQRPTDEQKIGLAERMLTDPEYAIHLNDAEKGKDLEEYLNSMRGPTRKIEAWIRSYKQVVKKATELVKQGEEDSFDPYYKVIIAGKRNCDEYASQNWINLDEKRVRTSTSSRQTKRLKANSIEVHLDCTASHTSLPKKTNSSKANEALPRGNATSASRKPMEPIDPNLLLKRAEAFKRLNEVKSQVKAATIKADFAKKEAKLTEDSDHDKLAQALRQEYAKVMSLEQEKLDEKILEMKQGIKNELLSVIKEELQKGTENANDYVTDDSEKIVGALDSLTNTVITKVEDYKYIFYDMNRDEATSLICQSVEVVVDRWLGNP